MLEDRRLWEDFSFVVSSRYREKVLSSLASKPRLPGDLAKETTLRITHVSRSLRELGQRGLVECLTPSAKARGRLYGVTEAGASLLAFFRDTNRRFVPAVRVGSAYGGFVPKIRASSVLRFLEHLRRNHGKPGEEVLSKWSVDAEDLTEDTWLSVDACAELLDLVESAFGDGSYGFIRNAFAEAVASFPTIRDQLLRAVPLEALAERAPIVWAKEWNFGRVEVETGPRRATFRHYDWMPTPAMCAQFHGIYEGVLRSRGFPGKVVKARCVRNGADCCEYRVEW